MIKQEVNHDKVLEDFVKKQKERIKKLKNKQKDKKKE